MADNGIIVAERPRGKEETASTPVNAPERKTPHEGAFA